MTRIAVSLGALLVPGLAAAHPDHTHGDFGFAHLFGDPFHVASLAAAALLGLLLWRATRRRGEARARHR
jgi:hypothetical protein